MSDDNFDKEIKKRGRRPLSPEEKEKNIRKTELIDKIDKNLIILTDDMKKEIEEKRLKYNEQHKKTYEKNKEMIKEKALKKYYEKKELQNSNSSKRGRPVGYTGKYIKSIKIITPEDNDIINEIKGEITKIKKIIKMLNKLNEDVTLYQIRIDSLNEKLVNIKNEIKKRKNIKNEIKKEHKLKPIEDLNYTYFIRRNVKKELLGE